ncbi:MAG: hypothetical protein IPK97_04500 [Ahniella sp.]|nr:hypothetical protein [Ahniella sp.]
MHYLLSTVVLSLSLVAMTTGANAQEATRTVKDKAEMSAAVMSAFSKESCTLIDETPRDGYRAGHLAMSFRLRCGVEEASASAVLKELQSKEGFFVERVALYPVSNTVATGPSVDVRFVAIAPTGVER